MEPFTYTYNLSKDLQLRRQRDISFEDIIPLLETGALLDVIEHPNSFQYGNQKLYVVEVKEYVYLVPFVRDFKKRELFLKTIFPSRKYRKLYKKERESWCKKNKT